MTMLLRSVVLAALLAGSAAAAFEPNEKQKNALEHISQVEAATRKCDDWETNMRLVGAIFLSAGININDPDTFAYADERVSFHIDRIKDRTREDICGAIERLYGPNGEWVSGLALRVK